MKWDLLEDAKKEAAKILGDDSGIPQEKVDLGKLAKDVGDAYSSFDEFGQDLRDSMAKLVDILAKWSDALKQTADLYAKTDFGLDSKADAQKIAKARKPFILVAKTQTVYEQAVSETKSLQKQYQALMKNKIPFP